MLKIRFIIIILAVSIISNIGLFYMYNKKNTEAEHRLNNLYMSFENGIAGHYAHLTNAKEGRGKEHLLRSYADLHSASITYTPLMAVLGLPYEDEIITFYTNKIKQWLVMDYSPTDVEYDIMINDLSLINDTFSRWEGHKLKDRSLVDWTVDEFYKNVGGLEKKLTLYENNQGN